MRRIQLLIVALFVTGLVRVLSGQTIDSYTARYYQPAATLPMQSAVFQASAVTCNQPVPVSFSTLNPTQLQWNDPANSGRLCIYRPAAGDVLLSFPIGSYEGTLTASNTIGTSPESARAPFTRAAVPDAPTGFSVGRP